MASDKRAHDLMVHLHQGGTITDPVYERMPLMLDSLPIAKTIDGKLTITDQRLQPDGTPLNSPASCFGRPDNACGKPANIGRTRLSST